MISSIEVAAIEQRAEEDAKRGVYQPDGYVLAKQGPQPQYDPVGNLEHAQVGSRLQNPAIEEEREDLRRAEDELARHVWPRVLLAVLLFLLVLEVGAALLLMRELGIAMPERSLFALAFAVFVFFLVYLCSRARSRLASYVAYAVLGMLIVAATTIRVGGTDEEGGGMYDWAMSVILLAVTLGPAVMAEKVMTWLTPAWPIVRRVVRLKNSIAGATRDQKRAERFVNLVARKRERWNRDAERRRAIYDMAWQSERADVIGGLETDMPLQNELSSPDRRGAGLAARTTIPTRIKREN